MKASRLALSVFLVFAILPFGYAGTTSVGSGNNGIKTSLSQTDAQKAFGIIYQTGFATDYPAAQYFQVVKLNCNQDKVAIAKAVDQGKNTDSAMTCDGEVGSAKLHLEGDKAAQLFAILSNYVEPTTFAQADYVEVKSLSCNLDLVLAGQSSNKVLSCSVAGI